MRTPPPDDPEDFKAWLAEMHHSLDLLMWLVIPVELMVMAVEIYYGQYALAVMIFLVSCLVVWATWFRRQARRRQLSDDG